MAATPPPWRIFDAPEPGTGPPGEGPPRVGEAGSAPRSTDGVRAGAASTAAFRRPEIVAGLAVAVAGLVIAGLIATAGPRGEIAVDAALGGSLARDPSGEPPAAEAGELVVDVAGAVLRPGVYRLPAGSRIADAIASAGGFGPRVDPDRVDRDLNLAAVLHDGDRILVPSRDDPVARGTAAPGDGGPGQAGGRVDLNTATQAELEALPGIGPVTAGKILSSRSERPFRAVEDLLERKLVGQKTFDAIKGLVAVG